MGTTTYHPLNQDEFRLLKLPPADQNATLHLQMFHSRLEWKITPGHSFSKHDADKKGEAIPIDPYEATSYTWGSPNPTKTVVCNGQETEMRENAFDFLQQLRLPQTERIVWMDCICINQDDNEEKAAQVEIMHWIYRSAKAVYIWLGQEADESALGMAYMSSLDTKVYLKEAEGSIGSPAVFRAKSSIFSSLAENSENQRLLKSILAIVQRPWLTRIWVQQEAALCMKTYVLCGMNQVPWDQFFSLLWLLTKNTSEGWPQWTGVDYTIFEAGLDAIHNIQRSRFTAYPPDSKRIVRPMAALLGSTNGCEATDPRDKVYALYNLDLFAYSGFGKKGDRPKIDYTAPWQIVYVRAARWMYDTRQANVIAMAGRANQRGYTRVPSWVPDWGHAIPNAFIRHDEWSAGGRIQQLSPRYTALPASNDSLPSYWYKDHIGRRKRIPRVGLELSVIALDRIAFKSLCLCTDSNYLADNIVQIQHIVQSDLEFCARNLPTYCTGETFEEAYAMTVIAGTDHEDDIASPEYAGDGFTEWREWLAKGSPDPWPSIHAAIESAALFTQNPFGVTAHGLMCLIPRMSRVGDYVAVLENVQFPYVLRRVGPPSENYFELIGQCYIHGMMAGRVWDLLGEFRCKYAVGSEDEVPEGVKRQVYVPYGGPEDAPTADPPFNAKGDYLNVRRILGTRKLVLV